MTKRSATIASKPAPRRQTFRERSLLVVDDADPEQTVPQLSIVLLDDGAVFKVTGSDEHGMCRANAVSVSREDFLALMERLRHHEAVLR